MHLPKFLSRSPSHTPDHVLSSSTPSNDPQTSIVGAGSSDPIENHYLSHDNLLKWIRETKQKLPAATPQIRKEAFLADPLLKGTIYPYLKNTLLKGGKIQTKDNKLYSAAIEEITDSLEAIGLMQCFRDDYLNFAILDGHSYRRIDPDDKGNIAGLAKLDPSSIKVYEDPWDSSIIAYHQKARINSSWSTYGMSTDVDSWFIPYKNNIEDLYATWVYDRGIGNNLKVFDVFTTEYKNKYNIADTTNLRIASSERIIAMHNSDRIQLPNYDNDYYRELINPAPIDSVLLAIWLKRLLLVNAPNLIFVVLSPFLHLKMGIIKESKDFAGNPIILSSLPQKPNVASPNYAAELANYTAFEDALKDSMKTLLKCLKEGGVFATGPDQELNPVESSRSVSFQLIKGLIDSLDEEIGHNFGFPISLIKATGTELASSRNILQNFNTVHAGERTEYEAVANRLIKKMFTGRTWQGEEGDYKFEDIKVRFELDTPDTKNLLEEAQTLKTNAETLTLIKGTGASQEDIQALGEEYGFGLLGLDNYDAQAGTDQPITKEGAEQINAILKSCLFKIMQEEGLISKVSPTAPSNFNENGIEKKLKEAYEIAQETIDTVFEGD